MTKNPFFDSRWVASRYGTSWALAILIFVNYLGTGYLVSAPDETVSGFNKHIYDGLFGLIGGLLVWGFGWVYRRKSTMSVRANLIAWVVSAAVASPVTFLLVTAFNDGGAPSEILEQQPFAMSSLLASYFGFTLLLSAINEGRRNLSVLRQKQRDLFASTTDSGRQVVAFASRLQTPVRERLEELVAACKGQLNTVAPRDLADRLFTFLNVDLRSLLTDISNSDTIAEHTPSRATGSFGQRAKIASSVRVVRFGQSLNLVATAMLPALYFLPSMWLLSGDPGAAAEAVVLAIASVVWLGVARIIGQAKQNWLLWALLNALIFGSATSLLEPLVTAFGGSLESQVAVATVFSTAFMAAASSSLESVIVRRANVQAETERMNVALQASLKVLQERLALLRKNVARHFHNNVQSKIVALALRLSSQKSLSEREQQDTLAELDAILAAMQIEAETVRPIESQLAEATEFWRGALEVTANLEPAAAGLIDANAELNARVGEVLREGLTNAAKYSTDGKVQVALRALDASRVQLVMTNKRFDQLDAISQPGVGSGLIAEAASGWSGTKVGEDFVLEVVFE
jgi:hypothetical protein